MKTETVKISEVKSNPNNPRIIKDDKFKKLVESVKTFPEMLNIRPIVVNSDMVVLGGNMRLRACKEAGLKEIPIIKADTLTPEQQSEFIIKDNVSGGEWDWDMLANEWNAEELDAWGLDVPVFAGEDEGNFDDEGIDGKSQYGVIVMCESEGNQESVFKDLQGMGYECKVVVT
jgi:ParB-like chromosome segregation protein Spo0J